MTLPKKFLKLPAKKSAAQYWSLRGISVAKLSIYKYVRTDKGWRYCLVANPTSFLGGFHSQTGAAVRLLACEAVCQRM